MKKTILWFWLLACITCSGTWAQTSVNMGSQNSITGCNINIYDDGGSTGSYGPSHNYTLTIYPSANQGRVFLEINMLDIHENDTLCIYDGAAATGMPMAALNNSTFSVDLNTNAFMASQYNTSGALTLRFKTSYFSFYANHGAGFSIHASCVAACSPFQIVLDSANCSHVPVIHSDGFHYIDLCPNEEVHLAVNGIYSNPQSSGYTQSDATTTFTWKLGSDVTLSGTGMDNVTHTFTPGDGFAVNITATDTLSCPAQNPITFRIRNSKDPVSQISMAPVLCEGDIFTPQVGYSEGSDIQLQEVGYIQHASLTVNDTVFLPDGQNCPPYGLYYRSNVTFTEFAPNATLTNANDILFVRIKMEHSAIEDLEIKLFCPNGSSSTILPNPNYTNSSLYSFFRVNLGSAYRPDVVSCNATLNPMGEPWNYVWSNNTTLGYQYASGNGSCYNTSNFHSHYNPHWDDSNISYFGDTQHSFSVDSSNVANMTQIYHPYQNFNSLVGCPLNGNWYIQVQDMEPYDNGYIVEWEMALNPDLMPSAWEYVIDVDTFYFTGNQVVDNLTLQPQTFEDSIFGLTLIDVFGCQYDTTFSISVREMPEISLGADRQICNGQSIALSPETMNDAYDYLWSTGDVTPTITVSDSGSYWLSARVFNNDTILCQAADTVGVSISDAVFTTLYDTLCAGRGYSKHGFHISAATLNQQETYTDSLALTTQFGCDSIVTLELAIVDTFLASHNSNPDFCSTEETVLSVEGNFDTYVWNTGDVTPFITVTESGNYSVTASNNVCDRTVRFQIPPCVPNFWLPNAITPSKGDALNDRFALTDYDKSQISELKITIYDRWGNLVFTSNDKNFFWDGTVKGKLSVNSVFSYIIHCTDHNGKAYNVTGTVTVL